MLKKSFVLHFRYWDINHFFLHDQLVEEEELRYSLDSLCTENLDVYFFHCESLFLGLWNSEWSLFLLALYRPPSSNALNFLEKLRDTLGKFQSVDICMIGDLNIDTL